MTKKAGTVICLLMLCFGSATAEQFEVIDSPIALSAPGEYYIGPRWSPSGDQVAVGGPNYTGLYLLDFPTGNTQQLSSDYSAGYGIAWSHDGSQIASKISHFDNMRRSHTLVRFNIADGKMTPISKPRFRMSGIPVWSSSDSYIYLTFAERFEVFDVEAPGDPQQIPLLHYIRDGRFQSRVLQQRSTSIETTQFSDQDHIYSYALSPDESHVVYSTAGQNLWVAKVNGENRRSLGRGSAPSWAPNGEWITFMLTYDDGYSITSSDIYVTDVRGDQRIKVTETMDLHEMNPHWSPDGEWIVYDTDQLGQLFVQQVGWR